MSTQTGHNAHRLRRRALTIAALLACSGLPLVAAPPAAAADFTNSTPITGAEGSAPCGNPPNATTPYALPTPYPSNISVSGQTGTISKVTVTLRNITGWNGDVEVLLVGPSGQKLMLVSDAGTSMMTGGGTTLTLDDAGAALLPETGSWGTSPVTAKPTDRDEPTTPDVFPSPAPAGPYPRPAPTGSATLASTFNGSSPNGTWSLYVVDDCIGDVTAINGGWSLSIDTAVAASTATAVSSSPNPSTTGSSVTFTAHVTRTGDGTDVTTGTVTFTRGGTTLAANVPLSGTGRASFSTSALTEGSHTIVATYSGAPSLATSNGSVTQVVNNQTVRTGNTFCNTGALTAPTNAATPYPSRIFTSGLGALSKVTMTLKGVSHPFPDDFDVLLVGPTGAKFVVVSDSGGGPPTGAAASNVTVTFDDDASSALANETGGWGTSGGSITRRPSNYDDGADSFAAPAPAGPYSSPAPTGGATFSSVFGGTDPNGTWQLFVYDDALGDDGSIANGWCLDFTTTSDAATATQVSSSANPSVTGSSVTFTAHVTRVDNSADVTTGTVTFKEGSTVLAGPVALGGNGRASFSTNALSEGVHTIMASYSGSPGSFNLSSGTLSQEVVDATTVTGARFCNTGPLTIADPSGPGVTGTAAAYPSKITVQGVTGNLSKVTVTLKGVTHQFSDDLDVLLVGPNGDSFVLVSDAGGGSPPNSPTSGVTVTFDDAAPGAIADTLGGWGTANTTVSSRPVDYAGDADLFPAPAPAAPYSRPAPAGAATLASVFDGDAANGTWKLFVTDDAQGQTGTFGDGWCLDVVVPPDAVADAYTATAGTSLVVAAPGVLSNDGGLPAPNAVAISNGATTEGGTVTLGTDGGFTYDAPSGFTGTDSFTYEVSNGGSVTDTATVTLTVKARPDVTGTTITRRQGAPASSATIANVTDADAPAGDVSVTANPPAGISVASVTNTAGAITADVGASCTATLGSTSVPLTATDGDSLTDNGTLTVDVEPNAVPQIAYGDTAVAVDDDTTIDPTTGPSDDTEVASVALFATSPAGFTGTIGVAGPADPNPGRITVTDAGPAGVYELTIRVTDNCGETTDDELELTVRTPPDVTGTTITRRQGAPASSATIANVTDADAPAGDVSVTANPPAGISVASVTNTAGAITADVGASCTATLGSTSVPLTATDGDSLTDNGTLTVDVEPNAAPQIAYGNTASVGVEGDDFTVDPTTAPADDTTVASIAFVGATPAGFAGTVSVAGPADPNPGRVTITDVGPPGVYELTIRATDNCGETTDDEIGVTVRGRPDVTGTTITRRQGAPASSATIANVTDADAPAGDVSVTANPPAGISVASVTNTAGAITADVGASCTAGLGSTSVPLTATDGDSLTDNGTLTVDVEPNAVPQIAYGNTAVAVDDDTTIDPTTGPSDDTEVASVALFATSPAGFTGTIGVAGPADPNPGRITVTDAGPAGVYELTIRVTDNCGETTDDELELTVTSRPVPGGGGRGFQEVSAGGPYETREGQPVTLEAALVGASDAGTRFTWDLDGDGTFGDVDGRRPTLVWGDLVALGIDDGPGTFPVRARATGGALGDEVLTSGPGSLTIVNEAPQVSATAPLGVAGAPLSLGLEADDPSPADEQAGLGYTIEWGDGTSDSTSDGPATEAGHTYARPGAYTVRVTATDRDGGTSTAHELVVHVAGAELVDDGCAPGGTALSIMGTPEDDRISLTPSAGGGIAVDVSGTAAGTFDAPGLVVIAAGDGDDVVSTGRGILVRRVVYGQGGDDVLRGRGGRDALVGGAGADDLRSHRGRDLLVGGEGPDRLRAGRGSDVLVGAATAFDGTDGTGRQALCALDAEWSRRAPYGRRVAHLTGRRPGGLNDPYFVVLRGPGTTVADDGAPDDLAGERGSDWFVTGGSDATDRIPGERELR